MLISFSAILLGLEKMLKDYDSLKTDTDTFTHPFLILTVTKYL